jgi:hypothetical protein
MALTPRRRSTSTIPEVLSGPSPAGGPSLPAGSLASATTRIVHYEIVGAASLDAGGTGAALLRRDEVDLISADEQAEFVRSNDVAEVLTGAPRPETVTVRLDPASSSKWDDRTVSVPLRLTRGGRLPTTGTGWVGWVELVPRNRATVTVPSSAVLTDRAGSYLLVATADGRTFAKRSIDVGHIFFGLASIRSGVSRGEQVLAVGSFFVDEERRLVADARSAAPGR